MNRPARVASLLALAYLFVQVAWILALPPFRGIDEFDHAYRAASVAHGQLLPGDKPVTDGRGEYVEVPRSLVESATPVCSSYKYTGPDNCEPGTDVGDGHVEVASAAARYNPAFYWLVGTAAQPFDGTAKLYALRLVASLLSAALVWCAAYALALTFRTAWPFLGLAAGVTPVFVYSTSLGAPNGVEMTAGLALWCALMSLRSATSAEHERRLILLASGAAAVMAVPRLLGPAWVLLIVVSAACLLGHRRLRELVADRRRALLCGTAVVGIAVLSSQLWNRVAAPNSLAREEDLGLDNPLGRALGDLPYWILQSMAAFPTRNESAPTVVYATTLLGLVIVLAAAGWGLGRRWWIALGLLTATWLAVQLAITVPTYSQLGDVWQGRYALPFAVGIPVAMSALAERSGRRTPHHLVVAALAMLVVVGHAVSIANVFVLESESSPLADSAAWITVPTWALVALVVAAAATVWAAARAGSTPPVPDLPAAVLPEHERTGV